jgi:hypothetical protein
MKMLQTKEESPLLEIQHTHQRPPPPEKESPRPALANQSRANIGIQRVNTAASGDAQGGEQL